MSDYRGSYRKTVVLAGLVALASLASMAAIVRFAPGTPWMVGLVALFGVFVCCALIATGGLVAVHRVRLELLGLPYAPTRPRERPAGFLARTWRSLRSTGDGRLALRPGDIVEVRSVAEILLTLDARGTLDGLPFMPEMRAYAGRRLRVHRRAEKVYDWIHKTGLRRLRDTVLLDNVRCDGASHGGCQAGCQILWKEAWLRVPGRRERATANGGTLQSRDLERLARVPDAEGAERYRCQITDLVQATSQLSWGDPRHYLRDVLTGNVRLGPFVVGISLALFNWAQDRRGGVGFPERTPLAHKSPHAVLDLQPGELVRIKTKREIEETLTPTFRNRGLWFDDEMLRYCGGRYRVANRVERLIEESSGKLMRLGSPSIVLEGVAATGEYLAFCPQNDLILWREIWLERVGVALQATQT